MKYLKGLPEDSMFLAELRRPYEEKNNRLKGAGAQKALDNVRRLAG